MGLTLRLRPLTAATFASYGFVASLDGRDGRSVNQGRAHRLDGFGQLHQHEEAARPAVALYDVTASSLPVTITLMERHPLTSQIFVPMGGASALIVVAPAEADGLPDMARAEAFLSGPQQAFCYGAGIWHAPLFAHRLGALFTMMMWETGDARDCEEHHLAAPCIVTG